MVINQGVNFKMWHRNQSNHGCFLQNVGITLHSFMPIRRVDQEIGEVVIWPLVQLANWHLSKRQPVHTLYRVYNNLNQPSVVIFYPQQMGGLGGLAYWSNWSVGQWVNWYIESELTHSKLGIKLM
jgi:hypothetical protein